MSFEPLNSDSLNRIGSDSNFGVSTSSVHLVTTCQAVHWFDLPAFYREVDRVLVPGGVLAIYGYHLTELEPSQNCSEEFRSLTNEV